jgi:hypothetical protein
MLESFFLHFFSDLGVLYYENHVFCPAYAIVKRPHAKYQVWSNFETVSIFGGYRGLSRALERVARTGMTEVLCQGVHSFAHPIS